MPFPAYEGAGFYFSITAGLGWTHQFPAVDRDTVGGAVTSWTGWSASCTFTDNNGTQLLTLTDGNGITLGDAELGAHVITLALTAAQTAALPVTGNPAGREAKAFIHATLTLTQPDRPGEPYLAAVGKGTVAPVPA